MWTLMVNQHIGCLRSALAEEVTNGEISDASRIPVGFTLTPLFQRPDSTLYSEASNVANCIDYKIAK